MARKIFTPGSAHWAVVTSADPLEIRPSGSSEGVPAIAQAGFAPAVGDRVVYVLLDSSDRGSGTLLVLGASSGGGVLGTARFEDPDGGSGISYGSGGNHPSSMVASTGDGASVFAYNGMFAVSFLVDGYYQASTDAKVTALNDGDVIKVGFSISPLNGSCYGYGIADTTGAGPGFSSAFPSATSPVFFASAGTGIEMSVDTVNVTTPDSSIDKLGMDLTHFGGA